MIDIESSCPDNDASARFELATRVHAVEGADLEALRDSGEPVCRKEDKAKAHKIGSAPGLVALVMDDSDTKILIQRAAYEEQWEHCK